MYAQIVDSQVQKIKDFAVFFPQENECLLSKFHVRNSHKSLKLTQGKYLARQGKTENTGN